MSDNKPDAAPPSLDEKTQKRLKAAEWCLDQLRDKVHILHEEVFTLRAEVARLKGEQK